MTPPTPETRSAMVLLNWSSVRPSGTWKTPLISIHVNSAAATVRCAKIRQLQIKLTSTAAIEIELLNVLHRSVNNVITVALTSGASKMSHGNIRFIGFAGSKFQAANVSDASCLPYAKQSDENGKTHRDFGGCDGDDEENENLCVIIGQAIGTDTESRKGNERQVCCVEHQLYRHENDDEIAP